MMRVLFWFIALAVTVLAFIVVLRADRGYVLVVFPPWRVDMSLPLLLGVLILSHVLFYFLLRLLRTTLRLPREVKSWRARRRRQKAEEALRRACGALLAGQSAHALGLARQSLELASLPLATLVGARAALAMGETVTAKALLDQLQTDEGELVAARQAISRQIDREAGASVAANASLQDEGAP